MQCSSKAQSTSLKGSELKSIQSCDKLSQGPFEGLLGRRRPCEEHLIGLVHVRCLEGRQKGEVLEHALKISDSESVPVGERGAGTRVGGGEDGVAGGADEADGR